MVATARRARTPHSQRRIGEYGVPRRRFQRRCPPAVSWCPPPAPKLLHLPFSESDGVTEFPCLKGRAGGGGIHGGGTPNMGRRVVACAGVTLGHCHQPSKAGPVEQSPTSRFLWAPPPHTHTHRPSPPTCLGVEVGWRPGQRGPCVRSTSAPTPLSVRAPPLRKPQSDPMAKVLPLKTRCCKTFPAHP